MFQVQAQPQFQLQPSVIFNEEMVYHEEKYQYLTMYRDMITTINTPGFSHADFKSVIGRLGLIKLQLHRFHDQGLIMYRLNPRCHTILSKPVGYFEDDFICFCNNLSARLDSLTRMMMTDDSVETVQQVYQTLRELEF